MAITYKPVAIIIDDFTSRSLTHDNVSLYEAGYWNVVTGYDYYTLDGYYVDGYGDIDSTATTSYGTLGLIISYQIITLLQQLLLVYMDTQRMLMITLSGLVIIHHPN